MEINSPLYPCLTLKHLTLKDLPQKMSTADTSEKIKQQLEVIPDKPGVYQFYNTDGTLIYVGKAKSLKKRVSSYFNRAAHESNKVRVMVTKVAEIRHIVVNTESDALLLENNLIKENQPRYNILLKDDKTFPWICIKREPFPRVFLTRKLIQDGSDYFGPYTSALMVRTLLNLVKQLYHLRNCSLSLSAENISKNKFKVCLEYHIGNCLGPCVGKQLAVDYERSIAQIRLILRGNIHQLISSLKDEMKNMATEYKFEDAELIRRKLEILEKFQGKSTIVNPDISDVDVFSLIEIPSGAIVNYIRVISGSVVQSHSIELKKQLDESLEELLQYAIVDIRNRLASDAPEIILPLDPGIEWKGVEITIPKIGDKKRLLELSERNARFFLLEKEKRQEPKSKEAKAKHLLEIMQKDLRMKMPPSHIECFDNSNIQGTNPVAACVVFRNGKPSSSEYRHFNVKTVTGPDDFASMQEIVYRRYARILEEKKDLPQLIVIDGGKGQLNAALSSLKKLELRGKITVIGIAKKLEEIYFPDDPVPLYLDKNSYSLKIIQHIRNEAHRFGIEFHRQKRSKKFLVSELENIEGIGESTISLILTEYRSLENIKKLSLEKLQEIVGKAKGSMIYNYFNP
jgi:excinuclease ABC subunit C